MHQMPRQSPGPGSPAGSPRTTPARFNNPRDEDTAESSSIQQQAEGQSSAPTSDAVSKLNQIIQNYYSKAALIILHSRVNLPTVFSRVSDGKKINKWFNVVLDETDVLRGDLRTWKVSDARERRPPPMIIDVYLDASELTNNQSLVIIDDQGKRWDVLEALGAVSPSSSGGSSDKVILERWRVELGNPPSQAPADLGAILPTVYKKSIVLFRSLYTYANFLPAWKLSKRQSQLRSTSPALKVRYRIYEGTRVNVDRGPDSLTVPIYDDGGKTTETYVFGATESPAGQFSVQVTYRTNCEFRVDDSEALLSSRFMGADDTYFRPSLPSDDTYRPEAGQEIGSLPVRVRGAQRPDLGQAYGSMSTFHQVGPTTGASPISALRAARDMGNASPSSPTTHAPPSPKAGQAARLAMRSGEGIPVHRRPSVSFQPFKAPPLSASPSLVDQPYGSSPRGAYGRTAPVNAPPIDDKNMPPPSTAAPASRKSSDNAVASSASASPKPAPISKYSSSFSHRRGRFSSGGGSKGGDEDNVSSGKVSASSSTVQPTSEVLAEAGGTSSGSLHAETDSISEFLKTVERGKGLFTPTDADAIKASAKKTSAALSKFQKMRDSNAALSDSMSSSFVMQRSSPSSSKQLPSPATASVPTSSSPGKQISPHTPHTPAIPSRLSSNSVIEYPRDDQSAARRHRLSHESRERLFEESANDSGTTETETGTETVTSNVNAIDIPTSPRAFGPSYRRSSSAVQRRTARRSGATVDDETGELYGMRSMSLGAEGRQQLDIDTGVLNTNTTSAGQPQSSGDNDATFTGSHSSRGARGLSYRSNPTRSQTQRGRGGSIGAGTGPPSHGSASSSFGRGNMLVGHLGDRDRDREPYPASSSNTSAISVVAETRRGGGMGRRFSSTRPATVPFEDEEPLLFSMSDFGVSRRSTEETRGGGSGDTITGNRRGSTRRGGSGSGYHAWP